MRKLTSIALILFFVMAHGQSDTKSVKTIKGITDKMLELISVPVGKEPNWEDYRNLFLPTAQKISLRPDGKPGRQVRSWNLEEFIRAVGPLYAKDGFKEVAVGLTINEYNGIASAFQSFHSKNASGTYESRGINCYQLVFADNRWWIANTVFVNEDPNNTIPAKYLESDNKG